MPNPTTSPHLDNITAAAAELETAEAAADSARRVRDHTVRAAVDAGAPIAHVARAANITRQTVYDIIRRQ